MNREMQNDLLIEKYLLGDLPEPEWEEVERQYFTDPDFLERVDAIEGDLIEDYVLGLLSKEKVEKIERHLLNSDYQMEKVKSAKALLRSVDEVGEAGVIPTQPARPRESLWGAVRGFFRGQLASGWLIPVAATLLLVCGWLVFDRFRLLQEREKNRQELAAAQRQERELNDKLAQQQKLIDQSQGKLQIVDETKKDDKRKEPTPPPPSSHIATFILKPVMFRNVQSLPRELTIAPDAQSVQLQLVYEGKRYRSYQAVMENANGEEVWRESGLRSVKSGNDRKVNFVISAGPLENRDYNVTLSGIPASGDEEDIGRYAFRIKRQ